MTKSKCEERFLDTWKSKIDYLILRELAKENCALFGSTCLCKSAFSQMKYLKNECRTRFLNGNLESQLRLISREIPTLASSARMQTQGSH